MVRPLMGFFIGLWLALTLSDGSLSALVGPEAELLDRVNAIRMEHHLHPLRGLSDLARVADGHAAEMAREGYLDHVNPAGENPLDRVRAAGLSGFALLAENIGATNERDPLAAIVRGWMASPVHRENLLNPAFNTSGVGRAETADGQTIVVQLFATFPAQRHASD